MEMKSGVWGCGSVRVWECGMWGRGSVGRDVRRSVRVLEAVLHNQN